MFCPTTGEKSVGSDMVSRIRPSGWLTSVRRILRESLKTIHPPGYIQANRSVAGSTLMMTAAGSWISTATRSKYGN